MSSTSPALGGERAKDASLGTVFTDGEGAPECVFRAAAGREGTEANFLFRNHPFGFRHRPSERPAGLMVSEASGEPQGVLSTQAQCQGCQQPEGPQTEGLRRQWAQWAACRERSGVPGGGLPRGLRAAGEEHGQIPPDIVRCISTGQRPPGTLSRFCGIQQEPGRQRGCEVGLRGVPGGVVVGGADVESMSGWGKENSDRASPAWQCCRAGP